MKNNIYEGWELSIIESYKECNKEYKRTITCNVYKWEIVRRLLKILLTVKRPQLIDISGSSTEESYVETTITLDEVIKNIKQVKYNKASETGVDKCDSIKLFCLIHWIFREHSMKMIYLRNGLKHI